MNLLKETLGILIGNGRKPSDVLWCGSSDFGYFSWEDFAEIADIEYSEGYGSAEIATDLLIVGQDFYLERREYDGSEWWAFKLFPVRPEQYRKPTTFEDKASDYGDITLCGLNKVLPKAKI